MFVQWLASFNFAALISNLLEAANLLDIHTQWTFVQSGLCYSVSLSSPKCVMSWFSEWFVPRILDSSYLYPGPLFWRQLVCSQDYQEGHSPYLTPIIYEQIHSTIVLYKVAASLCVSVCTSPPPHFVLTRQSDRGQIWHAWHCMPMWIDLGMVRPKQKLPRHPWGPQREF